MNEAVGLGTSIAEPVGTVGKHIDDSVGSQRRRCRWTDLIGDDAQFFPLLC